MSVSYSSPSEIIEEQRRNGARTKEQHLEMLADAFVVTARAIDPSIKNMWVGRDGPEFDRVFSIIIEREDSVWRKN